MVTHQLQALSKVAATAFIAVILSAVPAKDTLSQTSTKLPKQIVGNWIWTAPVGWPIEDGEPAVDFTMLTFQADGSFKATSGYASSEPTETCKYKYFDSYQGNAIAQGSKLQLIVQPGMASSQNVCGSIVHTTTMPLTGLRTFQHTISWQYKVVRGTEQLCIQFSPFDNGCYARQSTTTSISRSR